MVWVQKYRFRILKGQVANEAFNCIQIHCGRLSTSSRAKCTKN
ncbi:hypothetical protein D5R81_15535 [Parashewanella spongiae]|uniref:Uncharacterized protein n=1 Tax=Parashewanella spongiae TaxID=342950 RepID=A0A3A6THY9_9GAMM|nr:hypothetical protein D5R81_15535 [Parashewanella spongiae]